MAESRHPTRVEIYIEHDGRQYRGNYTLDGSMVRVSYPGGGEKTTQVGGLHVSSLARMLLAELVAEELARAR